MTDTLDTVSHLGLKKKLKCSVVGRENLLWWVYADVTSDREYIFLKVNLK